jgi:selenocysteine lyase/cysteine desulfurase
MNIDNSLIRREFPLDDDIIYLNHAAVAPWPKRTSDTIKKFAEENTYSGAKNYVTWLDRESILRKQLKWLINAPSTDDIALLKNTSEAISIVACGLNWRDGENVVSTDEEFPSNRIPWQAQRKSGVEFREINILHSIEPELDLINACDDKTRVLTVSSVQYGSGIRLDLQRLGNFCTTNNILFCVDAIQSLGVYPLDVQAIQADFVMADSHKWMLGPEGIALFYCKSESRNQLELRQFGWHMIQNAGDYDTKEWQPADNARRFECGSPNMLGIHALSASLSLFEEIGLEPIYRNILENTSYLIDQLNGFTGIEILTPRAEKRRAGIVTFKISNQNMHELHANLLKNNVICACRSGGIRFSPHFYTAKINLDVALDIIDIYI